MSSDELFDSSFENGSLCGENSADWPGSVRLSAIGQLAAGVVHEICSPLTIIHSRAEFLLLELQASRFDSQVTSEGLSVILRMSERIGKLVQGMRLLSRDGASDPLEKVTLQTLVSDVMLFLQYQLKAKGVDLHLDLKNPEVPILCRVAQMSQVILNLVNNAVDAQLECEKKWVSITMQATNGRVLIEIADGGPGVPTEHVEKIFEPFFTTKPRGLCTGLGLSLSREILSQFNANLELRRAKNPTCFSIEMDVTP